MFIERICVATDGSDLALRAAQLAVLLTRTGGGRIVAVSVAQPPVPVSPAAGGAADLEAQRERAAKAASAHVATVARVARAGGVACEEVALFATPQAGSHLALPGPDIIGAAEAHRCDLIVMGAHGPHDGIRPVAGSSAQYLLARSPIPVLVYRDPREAMQPEFAGEA
ncbi:universal stress protein [Massilia sp. SYSU DXS3249]